MVDFLFVHLRDDTDSVEWLATNSEGRLLGPPGSGGIEGAAASAQDKRVIVLVPGGDVITTQAELPSSSQARLRQMLPFAIEDRFADDVDSLMFAAGPRLASGDIAVSVVSRAKLDAWISRVRDAGISPSAIYAETDGVPDTPSTITLLVEGEKLLGRRPGEAPITLEGLKLEQAFRILNTRDDDEPATQHAIIYIDQESYESSTNDLNWIEQSLASLSTKVLDQGMLPALAAKLVHEPGTNLLQGPYAPKSDWIGALQPWRLAGALLAGLAIATLLSMAAEYFSLRQWNRQLETQIVELCQEQFGIDRLAQCTDRVQTILRGSGEIGSASGEGFLSTLDTLAQFTATAQELENISYRNRIMDLQLNSPDVASLDNLSREISETGRFDVSIRSTTPSDSGIEGRIQIVGAEQ